MSDHVYVSDVPYSFLQRAVIEQGNRFIYLYGGAASGKSWACVDFLLIEIMAHWRNCGILCVRRTRPEVKKSCWRLAENRMMLMGDPYITNRSDLWIRNLRTNATMYFTGIDDVLKQKSIEGINIIWIEEATEFNVKEVRQLNLRARAQNRHGKNCVILTFNPEDPIANEWLKDRTDAALAGTVENSAALRVNYDENPFLQQPEIDEIEALREEDEEYDKIYRLGEWATPSYLIYSQYEVVRRLPDQYDDRVFGLDFGYSSNPAALVEVRFRGDEIHCHEHVYETGLTNPELIALLSDVDMDPADIIVADSAEPKSIQEIRNAGYNIHGTKKGPDSVLYGINTVKSMKLHVTADSTNIIRELKGYKWKQDKQLNPLDQPLKFMDHALDGIRYAVVFIRGTTKPGVEVRDNLDDVRGPEYDAVMEDDYWQEF